MSDLFPWETPAPLDPPDDVVETLTETDRELADPVESGPAPELSAEERATVERIDAAPDALEADELLEQGRQLASEREDLVAAGVDPAELTVPLAPGGPSPLGDMVASLQQPDPDDGVVDAHIVCDCPQVAGGAEHVWDLARGCPPIERLVGDPATTAAGEVVQWVGMDGVDAVLDGFLADPQLRGRTIRTATDGLVNTVRTRADERRKAHRPDKVRTPADLRRELVGASDDAEILDDMARVFSTAAKEARGIAGDLLAELPARGEKPRASAVVADGTGMDLKVSTTRRRELSVKHAEVDDVLGTWTITAAQRLHEELKAAGNEADSVLALGVRPQVTYAQGVRDGIGALRGVLGASPPYKSTALDELVKSIGGANEDELAKRLATAYGKVEKGEPSVKLERTPSKPAEPETPAAAPEESEQ